MTDARLCVASLFSVLCAAVTVTVNAQPCTSVQVTSENTLSCILPPGVGRNRPVVVTSSGSVSRSVSLVSYAAPTVTAVGGCDPGPSNTSTVNCPRLGNAPITVYGTIRISAVQST
jgi:hypothetical protein